MPRLSVGSNGVGVGARVGMGVGASVGVGTGTYAASFSALSMLMPVRVSLPSALALAAAAPLAMAIIITANRRAYHTAAAKRYQPLLRVQPAKALAHALRKPSPRRAGKLGLPVRSFFYSVYKTGKVFPQLVHRYLRICFEVYFILNPPFFQ